MANLERIREIHASHSVAQYGQRYCAECFRAWPCPTVLALDDEEEPLGVELLADDSGTVGVLYPDALEELALRVQALLLAEGWGAAKVPAAHRVQEL